MISPAHKGDGDPSLDLPTRQSLDQSGPLMEAVRRHRRSYEIEDETLIEIAALLDGLSRRYRREIEQRIEDCRLLKKQILVAELHHAYLRKESAVMGDHIGKMLVLYREATAELRVTRRWIDRLYPGWKRIFDEACRRARNTSGRK